LPQLLCLSPPCVSCFPCWPCWIGFLPFSGSMTLLARCYPQLFLQHE
jgi:hypothetical protein